MTDTRLKHFRDHFSSVDWSEHQWIPESEREKCLRLAEAVGLPDSKDESWKYSPVAKVFKDLTVKSSPFQYEFKSELPEGVTLCPIADMAKHLNIDSIRTSELGVFDALNWAFINHGYFLKVSANVKLEEPIRIVATYNSNDDASLFSSRSLVVVEEGAEAHIVEETRSHGHCIVNSVTKVQLSPGAHLSTNSIQVENPQGVHIQNTYGEVNKDALWNYINANLGLKMGRAELKAELKQSGAEVRAQGLSVLSGQQNMDMVTDMRHLAAHTQSHQLFKGVLGDQSRNVFTGRQYIAEDAQKVDSSQLSKNLLLSDKAEADSRPQLEVNADDVKATHGAAIGQMNPDELFYLMSRALPREVAYSMLASGYALDVIEQSTHNWVREYLRKMVELRVSQLAEVGQK